MNDLFLCSHAYDLLKIDKTQTDINHCLEPGPISEKLVFEGFEDKDNFIRSCSSAEFTEVLCANAIWQASLAQFFPASDI